MTTSVPDDGAQAGRPPRWTEYQPVDGLVPALRNSKDHDQGLLAASIDEFGFVDPVVVDERTGRLWGGHGRKEFLETRQLWEGATAPDGIVVDETGGWCVLVLRGVRSRDDAHAEALGIALNRVGEKGGWKPDVLVESLDEILQADDGLLGSVGFTSEELDDMIAQTSAGYGPDDAGDGDGPDDGGREVCPNCGHPLSP